MHGIWSTLGSRISGNDHPGSSLKAMRGSHRGLGSANIGFMELRDLYRLGSGLKVSSLLRIRALFKFRLRFYGVGCCRILPGLNRRYGMCISK